MKRYILPSLLFISSTLMGAVTTTAPSPIPTTHPASIPATKPVVIDDDKAELFYRLAYAQDDNDHELALVNRSLFYDPDYKKSVALKKVVLKNIEDHKMSMLYSAVLKQKQAEGKTFSEAEVYAHLAVEKARKDGLTTDQKISIANEEKARNAPQTPALPHPSGKNYRN